MLDSFSMSSIALMMASRYWIWRFGGEESHFELASNGGDGRAELVRNVGREAADLLEGLMEPLRHLVKTLNQVIQFVARPAQRRSLTVIFEPVTFLSFACATELTG